MNDIRKLMVATPRPQWGRVLLMKVLLLGGVMACLAPLVQAQDRILDGVAGGSVTVTGNLNTDSFSFTHTLPDSTTVSGGVFVPDLSNYVNTGGVSTLNTVTIAGAATVGGDVFAGNLSIPAANFGGIAFQDGNDQVSGGVFFALLGFAQGNGQLSFGANGVMFLTDNASGNSLSIRPADFTISLNGRSSGMVSLFGENATVTNYGSTNMSLDFSDTAHPFVQLYTSAGSSKLTGNSSAATFNFAQAGGGGLTISPTGQTISFSNGFVLNGNSTSAPFGGLGVALGNDADAGGSGVAIGYASANGSLAIALGDNSIAVASGSVALIGGNVTGTNAMALGANSIATAAGSAAFGPGTLAQTWGTVVVGHNNQVVTGNATVWAADEPALIVGIGANSTTDGRASALVIFNNGHASITGPASLIDPSKTLQVNGSAILNGQATFSGNMVLTQPRGDISSGIYSR